MSDFDFEYISVPNAIIDRDAINAAVAAARRAATRSGDVGDVLTDLPGASAPLRIDDVSGVQYLRRHSGLFARFDYCARIDVVGVLPRLSIEGRFAAPSLEDARTFGPLVNLRHKNLTIRSRSPSGAALFDNDDVALAFSNLRARVALRPETARRSVVEVDVVVGDGRVCTPAADLARLITRLCRAALDRGLAFAEAAADGRAPAERIEALVARVTEAVHWVSGPVARVGDGVEARLAIDEQPDAPSVMRFDLDNAGHCAVYFEGRLADVGDDRVRLAPQDGFVDRMRGLVDVKVDDAALDEAWLIDGAPALARRLARHKTILLGLRERAATVEVAAAGLVVRVPAFADDDAAVVDVAGALLTLWRNLIRDARGLNDG